MRIEIAKILTDRLKGRRLIGVDHREFDWAFGFAADAGISVNGPWRVLVEGSIRFASSDDGQKFGLPEPINGGKRTQDLLGQAIIKTVTLREGTGDLSIFFDNAAVLEIFNMSCGYESWHLVVSELEVIATGGGELAIMGLKVDKK
jgi:hypothetical protein